RTLPAPWRLSAIPPPSRPCLGRSATSRSWFSTGPTRGWSGWALVRFTSSLSQQRTSFVSLRSDTLRAPVERLVSDYLRRSWVAAGIHDLNQLASHPSAILSDGAYSVFVKYADAPDGLEQFTLERASLQLLTRRAGVRTPAVIGVLSAE